MKKRCLPVLLLAALSSSGTSCQKAARPEAGSANAGAPASQSGASGQANQPPAAPTTHLKVGDAAPDFALTDTNGQPVRLSDFRGKKNVALAFYVMAFTGG